MNTNSFSFILTALSVLIPFVSVAEDEVRLGLLDSVHITLRENPNIQIQSDTREREAGVFQEARGDFDVVVGASVFASQSYAILTEADRESAGRDNVRKTSSGFSTSASKKLRMGQTLSFKGELERLDDAIDNPSEPNTGTISFTLLQPLLRGRGLDGASAEVRAAEDSLEAESYLLKQTVADAIASTTKSYWNYLSAIKRLEIREENKRRVYGRHRNIITLVNADERPRTDIAQSLADVADAEEELSKQEINLYAARQALGLDMGIAYEEIPYLPLPKRDFPKVTKEELTDPRLVNVLAQEVLEHRGEYLAAKARLEAAEGLLRGAKRNALPEVNLLLKAGYTAQKEGGQARDYFEGLSRDIPGANAGITLSYSFPIQNNERREQLAQAKANVRIRRTQLANLKRTILSNVSVALKALEGGASAYKAATESAASYREALNNELKKYRLGMSTLTEIQQVEDNFVEAQLDEVNAANLFSNALIELRRATGDIIDIHSEDITLTEQLLISAPEKVYNRKKGK